MTDQASPPASDNPYALRCAAISLADGTKARVETDLAAAKKRWSTKLEAATKAFNEAKPKHESDTSNMKARWLALHQADAEHQRLEAAKAKEIDAIKARLKKAEATFWSLVRSKVDVGQVSLALALGEHNLDGFGLPTEAAAGVARAIAEVEKAGGTLSADEQRLRARLEASGVVFSLDDEQEPEDSDADEAAEEDSEDEEPEPANDGERHLAAVQ